MPGALLKSKNCPALAVSFKHTVVIVVGLRVCVSAIVHTRKLGQTAGVCSLLLLLRRANQTQALKLVT